ncbi:MAG: hypothetical protein HIU81_13455 [Acidobacteria bacterium]|nr:hypothetical protein [Acidobacteriota bacterium]
MPDDNQRIVLLNWLISRSTTHAREHAAPTISGQSLLDILAGRLVTKQATEQMRSEEGAGGSEGEPTHSIMRLSDVHIETTERHRYVALLVKYLDISIREFSVEDMVDFTGREISGLESERGVTAVHLMTRLPRDESQLDLGRYRCVVDYSAPLTRKRIEYFLCRQLRRQAEAEEWKFSANVKRSKRGKVITKEFKYVPRLELHMDVSRGLNIPLSTGTPELSSMKFTKRSERQSIGKKADVKHEEVLANIQIVIHANQGPSEAQEKRNWVSLIRNHYTGLGYDTKLYYRHVNGSVIGGDIHQAIDGATDLLLCPREFLSLAEPVSVCPRTY